MNHTHYESPDEHKTLYVYSLQSILSESAAENLRSIILTRLKQLINDNKIQLLEHSQHLIFSAKFSDRTDLDTAKTMLEEYFSTKTDLPPFLVWSRQLSKNLHMATESYEAYHAKIPLMFKKTLTVRRDTSFDIDPNQFFIVFKMQKDAFYLWNKRRLLRNQEPRMERMWLSWMGDTDHINKKLYFNGKIQNWNKFQNEIHFWIEQLGNIPGCNLVLPNW